MLHVFQKNQTIRRALALGAALFFLVAAGWIFVHQESAAEPVEDKALAAGLAPHKALYAIALESTRSGSQIVNIDGQMMYEWYPSCEAWISNHRFNLSYEYADSPALRVTSDFSTFEPFDGAHLNFTSQRKRDGELFEELRGHAVTSPDRLGEAVFTLPKDLEFDLPEGTLFPIGHTLSVLDKIRQGKKFYKAVIFDGSDEEGPVEVNVFIGQDVNVMAQIKPSADIDAALLNTPAHKVQLAFFPLQDPSPTPDYEMTVIFHENGVISDMVIAYDDFSISQKLVALDVLAPSCGISEKKDPK